MGDQYRQTRRLDKTAQEMGSQESAVRYLGRYF